MGWVLSMAITGLCLAQEDSMSRFRLGGHGSFGLASAVGSFDNTYENTDGANWRPTVAAGIDLCLYLTPRLVLNFGAELLGQGYKVTWRYGGATAETWTRMMVLRVPIILLAEFKNGYQLGGGLAFDTGLKGSTQSEFDGVAEVSEWETSRWNNHRRFNLAAIINVNYVIGLKHTFVIPGLQFAIQLLNNIQGDSYAGVSLEESERHLNVMLVLRVMFGL